MVVTDYNEQFLDKRGTDHLIDELKAYIDNLPTGGVDLSDYVTKSELQAKLDALDINIDLSSYATKEELNTAINSIDLSAYAKKTDIPSLDAYAKKSDIPSLEGYVTETELSAKGYLTEHQDLSAYALKTEIPTVPSLDGYATTEYVDNAVSNIPTTDLSNYYTKSETYSKTEVDTLVANSGGSSSGGASGITYAYDTEIATGDTYFDGRPIYMRIFHIDPLSSAPSDAITYGNYKNQTPFADKIISTEPVWYTTSSTQNVFTGNVVQSFYPATGSSGSAAVSAVNRLLKTVAWVQAWQTKSEFAVTVTRGQDMYHYACDVFVKYVKSA